MTFRSAEVRSAKDSPRSKKKFVKTVGSDKYIMFVTDLKTFSLTAAKRNLQIKKPSSVPAVGYQ